MSIIAILVSAAIFLLRDGCVSSILWLLGLSALVAAIWAAKVCGRDAHIKAHASGGDIGPIVDGVFSGVFVTCAVCPLLMLILLPAGLLIRTR